ncbi:MAG: cytochrome c biogenesis protein ResB [Candidatus Acidulodesulfobacterium sp.]
MLSKLNKFISSVKLAIFLFITIAVLAMIGTFINQGDTIKQYKTIFSPAVYHLLYWLGFLNIYDSWYFIALALLLIVNLIAASINMFPRTMKAVFGPYPSFQEVSQKKNPKAVYESIETKNKPEELKSIIGKKFGGLLSEKTSENGDKTELYYSRNSIFRFSPYISHISVIIIIAGVLLNFKYGFRSYTNIKVGQKTDITYLLKNNKPIKLPFTIRLDRYRTTYYNDGIPKAYISKISIIEKHIRVLTKNIMVNHPLTYKGITIYQASYGHYKPNKHGILLVNFHHIKSSRKIIFMQVGKFYDSKINNIKFKLIRVFEKTKKKYVPYAIQLSNKKILNFSVFPIKNGKFPLIITTYKNVGFIFTPELKTYYYSGVEISKNTYVSLVWIGCIILVISLFFSFFFNHEETWVLLSSIKDAKKTKVEIVSIPKKKFNSFYKKFDKKINELKKYLH